MKTLSKSRTQYPGSVLPLAMFFFQLLIFVPTMNTSEKLCLKWNDFQENVNSAFGRLRNDTEFSDVTLACEDGTQIESHKAILASSSPFFMDILKKNKHPHPLIFMRGAKAEELFAIVDFLYYGEAKVVQENLDSFLALAEDLRLKGLTNIGGDDTAEAEEPRQKFAVNMPNPGREMTRPKIEQELVSKMSLAHDTHDVVVNVDLEQLDEQIKSMMESTENILIFGNKKARAKLCKVCGKEGDTTNIMKHIEANHISTTMAHSCDICGKSSRSRHELRLHTSKGHHL